MKFPRLFISIIALLALAGCASTGNLDKDDPLQPVNRVMYNINRPIETVIVRPVAKVYTTIMPNIMQQIVANFFGNIGDLFSGVAGVMEGKFDKAGNDFGRVIINTSFGLGGLIDFASDANIPRGGQDFGMVLAHYGIGPRPYLFLPFFGPMTARDGIATGAVSLVTPTRWLPVRARNTTIVLKTADTMKNAVQLLDTMNSAALDQYTFIRNSYLQNRAFATGHPDMYKSKTENDDVDLDELMNESAPETPKKTETPKK
jgi:phospholipid-binding lipoprotein MlaA